MNMKVVGEGIEDREQLDLLTGYKVDEMQGYLLSKPVEAETVEAMMRKPKLFLDEPAKVVQLRP